MAVSVLRPPGALSRQIPAPPVPPELIQGETAWLLGEPIPHKLEEWCILGDDCQAFRVDRPSMAELVALHGQEFLGEWMRQPLARLSHPHEPGFTPSRTASSRPSIRTLRRQLDGHGGRDCRLTVLHRFLQFLGNSEGDLLTRLDLDRLTSCRVSSHPGRPLPHLEDAEAGQADFVPFLEVPGCQRHQIAQHGLGLPLRQS